MSNKCKVLCLKICVKTKSRAMLMQTHMQINIYIYVCEKNIFMSILSSSNDHVELLTKETLHKLHVNRIDLIKAFYLNCAE